MSRKKSECEEEKKLHKNEIEKKEKLYSLIDSEPEDGDDDTRDDDIPDYIRVRGRGR
jgi:hypothetical protein